MKLSLYHVIALSTAVSLSLVWVYWKMNKLEKQVREIGSRVNANATTLANLGTALELCNTYVPEPMAFVSQTVPQQPQPVMKVDVVEETVEPQSNDNMSVSSEDVKEVLKTIPEPSSQDELGDEVDSVQVPVAASDDTEAVVSEPVKEHDLVDEDATQKLLLQLNDPSNWVFSEEELKKKTVDELKTYLNDKQLSTKGNKKDLIQRILENKP